MPTIYTQADAEVSDLATKLIRKHFADLQEVDTNIGYLFAAAAPSDTEGEPPAALKYQGVAVDAIIRVTSYKDRIAGLADVIVYIDSESWNVKSAREKEALLYRKFFEIQLKRDKEGTPICDDAGRPKFKRRPVDFHITGYYGVAKAYGSEAPEVQAFAATHAWMQKELAFG